MRKKNKYENSDPNILLGSISLIFVCLFSLTIFYHTPILANIYKFLGWGTYPLILFFVGLTLKSFNIYEELSGVVSKFAQLFLVIILASIGFAFDRQECSITINTILRGACSLGNISGFGIVNALGDDASKIFLIVLSIILVPVALNISFDKIHLILSGIFSGIQIIFSYLAIFISSIVDNLQTWLYELKENRRMQMEQKAIDKTEAEFEKKSSLGESKSWVNPAARKKNVENDDYGEEFEDEKPTKFVAQKENAFDDDLEIEKDATTKSPNIVTMSDMAETNLSDAIVSVNGLEYPDWQLPSLKLLDKYENVKVDKSDVRQNIERIERTYESFNMKVEVVNAVVGPTVTQYQMNIATGVSVRAIITRQPDVALALGVNGIRIEPIPGQSLIGLEVPNRQKIVVKFSEIMEELRKKYTGMRLGCVLGKSIDNNPVLIDLQKMPHVLVAGTTGSGKSVLTNSLIMSLLMTKSPDELKLILVDPKKVEFSDYNDIPHLLTPVIVESEKVMNAMKWAVEEMERRYTILSNAKARNIEGYNEKAGFTAMPYIVIVIDELADLMNTIGKAFEAEVLRIAQKARATGIHLVLATQRPSVDIITGVLKGNIPGRIALKVASQQDSRVIMDRNGAETLVGNGDMLLSDPGKPAPHRVQGTWVDQKEIARVVEFIVSQVPDDKVGTNYKDSIIQERWTEGDKDGLSISENGTSGVENPEDSLLHEAIKVIYQSNRFSTSLLQTYLKIGFNKASRMKMDLEAQGFIVPSTSKQGAFEINRDKIANYLNSGNSDSTNEEMNDENGIVVYEQGQDD